MCMLPSVCASVRRALPCGHDTDHSLCPITFKLNMQVDHGERRNSIDFGSLCLISRLTLAPCEGMPCFALSSYMYIVYCNGDRYTCSPY